MACCGGRSRAAQVPGGVSLSDWPIVGTVLALVLLGDTLRRVYAVGKEANDHFVAVVVCACMGLYGLQWVAAPQLWPLWSLGMVGLWGLFFCLHREKACPRWLFWGLAWPSQLAYAFALWAGLTWLIRAPIAWALGASVLWAGPWLLLPFGLALLGCLHALRQGQRVTHHKVPKLPARVVQLSDLHASPLMAGPELMALVDQVNALEPALVLITGDQVMPFSEAQHDYLLKALASSPQLLLRRQPRLARLGALEVRAGDSDPHAGRRRTQQWSILALRGQLSLEECQGGAGEERGGLGRGRLSNPVGARPTSGRLAWP